MFKTARCAAIVAFMAGGAFIGLTPASAAPTISKAVSGPLSAAIKAVKAGNWQEVLTQARAAQAVPDRTPFDDLEINLLIGQAAVNLKDMNTATTAFEAAADSSANTELDPAERQQVYYTAMQLASNAQHSQKVIAYSNVLEQLNKMDDLTYSLAAIAYYELKDSAKAAQYAQKSIDASKAAGKQPQENALKILTDAQAQSNPAAAEQNFEALVMRTNAPGDWGQLIEHAFGTAGMNDVFAMDLYRLEFLTHSLGANAAGLAGKLANLLRYYGDAVAILEGAGLKNADLSSARTNAAREQGSIPAEIAAARKGNGQVALSVAEALYGYGRFAEAEQLAREAIAKGHAKYPGQADILLGMSLIRQGKYADAVQALNVTHGSAAAMKTAHLWLLYAQIKQGGATPAQAQAPSGTPPAH